MIYKKTLRKGFTLVEILIAISILSIAILATFTAVSNSLKSTNFSEDQTAAYYLADEALEYIRNRRDSNAIQHINNLGSAGSFPWLSGVAQIASDPCYPGKVCYVDIPNNTIGTCASNAASCPVLQYNASSGLYQYTTGTATQFKRSLAFTAINSTEMSITVSVAWTTQGISKTYSQTLVLKNWTE